MSAQDDLSRARPAAADWSVPVGVRDWLIELGRALWRDRGFWAVIAGFFTVADVAAAHFGRPYLYSVTQSYLVNWVPFCLPILVLLLPIHLSVVLLRERSASPLARSRVFLAEQITPERVAGFALFAALPVFLGAFTTLKTLLPLMNPFWADPLLAEADRLLHFGRDPWVWLQPLMGRHAVTEAVQILYLPIWMMLTLLMPMHLCVATRDAELRRRFIAAYLLVWIVNGVFIAGLMMSGGPAFYAEFTGDPARFKPLLDYLAYDLDDGASAISLQRRLLMLQESGKAGLGTGISEFPSLHVSIAVLCALAGARINRALGWVLAAFAGAILVGSIHLGWHYAVGGYFAALSTWGWWWLAGRVTRGRVPA